MKNKKIGVMDSGIGGLTVAKELQRILPGEDLIYFGDNKNCPYGNRSKEEILELTRNILRFFEKEDVKLVAIACNTISTLIHEYRDEFNFPIFDIIYPTVEHISNLEIEDLGIIATEFTIKSNLYQSLLKERNKDMKITDEGSPKLAGLVDKGEFNSQEIKDVVKGHLENMSKEKKVENLVLGCTHYPIVEELFIDIDNNINIINPAVVQAETIKSYLTENQLLNNKDESKVEVYTTGDDEEIYKTVIDKLEIKPKNLDIYSSYDIIEKIK